MKTRPTLTLILCFCSQQKCISNQYQVRCSIGVYLFAKGALVLLLGILSVPKTIDCVLISDTLC